LNEAELGAVMSAVVTDSHKASNSFMKYQASFKVQEIYEELEKMVWDLKVAQSDVGIEFPVALCREVGGLAESWVNGISWRELCRDTSLDQGDICRTLRRTVEILRQIPMASGIDPSLAQTALRAANRMDRFPVAEMDAQTGESKDTSGIGFGVGSISVLSSDIVDAEGIVDSLLLDDDEDINGNENNNIAKILSDNFFDGPLSGNEDDRVGLYWKSSEMQKQKVASILNEIEGGLSNDITSAGDSELLIPVEEYDLDELLGIGAKSQGFNGSKSQEKKKPSAKLKSKRAYDAEVLGMERAKFEDFDEGLDESLL